MEVDFQGGEITSDAGSLFLSEVEKQIGIIRRIADVIHVTPESGLASRLAGLFTPEADI